MANENKDVLRVEDTSANMATTLRDKMLGFETDTKQLAFKETGVGISNYNPNLGDQTHEGAYNFYASAGATPFSNVSGNAIYVKDSSAGTDSSLGTVFGRWGVDNICGLRFRSGTDSVNKDDGYVEIVSYADSVSFASAYWKSLSGSNYGSMLINTSSQTGNYELKVNGQDDTTIAIVCDDTTPTNYSARLLLNGSNRTGGGDNGWIEFLGASGASDSFTIRKPQTDITTEGPEIEFYSDTLRQLTINSRGVFAENRIYFGSTSFTSGSPEGLLVEQNYGTADGKIWNFENGYLQLGTDNSEVARLLATGGMVYTREVTRKTANYTLTSTDHTVFCDTDGGDFTITLPAGSAGRTYRVINCGSGTLTIAPDGSELLLGSNSNLTAAAGSVYVLTYESTEGWW